MSLRICKPLKPYGFMAIQVRKPNGKMEKWNVDPRLVEPTPRRE